MLETNLSPKARWNRAFQRLWTLHWIMAACFLVIYLLGIIMARLPYAFAFRGAFYNTHKSLGILVLGLLLIRVLFLLQVFSRKYLKRSPKISRQWLQNTLLYTVLYLFMVVIPISGVWLSNSGGHSVSFFFIPLPDWFAENRAVSAIAHDLHFWLAYALLACVGLHLMQQRRFVERIRQRILP